MILKIMNFINCFDKKENFYSKQLAYFNLN